MLGDLLLIQEKHEKAAQKIMERILKEKADKYIVAISGESGSGKSEVTYLLAKLLKKEGIAAKPIHIDNYYKIHPKERTEWRKKHGIQNAVGFNEYDWKTINRNIEDFKNNKKSTMPCIDIITDQVDSLTTNFNGIDMLVIDGLYAIKTEGVNLRVFIELTYRETKKAQVVRGKEPQNEYRMQVLEREHQVVQSLRPTANLLITKKYVVVPFNSSS